MKASSVFSVVQLLLLLCVFASNLDQGRPVYVDFNYHDYNRMTSLLKSMNDTYPDLVQLYSIGKSVQGRELWVMLVSRNPRTNPLLKPNVKYVANMHGDESVGRELMLHLIAYLVNNYRRLRSVKSLMDSMRIHILPSMNPDSFEKSVEGNCRGSTRFVEVFCFSNETY